jgi:sugar phosphate isomerase/epimerase
MRPSISTSYLREWEPYAMVKAFAQHGWGTLELHDTHASRLLRTGRPDEIGTRFARFAADHGVTFPQCHFSVARWDDEGEFVEHLDVAPASDRAFAKVIDGMGRWIDFLNAVGVTAGVLHIGGNTLSGLGWSDMSVFERRVEALSTIAALAAGTKLTVCFENMFHELGIATAGGMLEVIAATGRDNVGICLDTGHANLAGVEIPTFVLTAGSRLKALHVSDNLGQVDDHILPYGKGTIKWEPVVPTLKAIRYGGVFNMELPGEKSCPPDIRLLKLDYALKLAETMIDGA